jgi:sugar phosphate isomerase/epimerase
MTRSSDARFSLGVSLHTLDPEQRLDTMRLLRGSSVKAVELWEPTFDKDESKVQESHRALAAAGVEPRTVHAGFDSTLDISSPDPAIRSAGMQAIGVALQLAVGMGARTVIVHASGEYFEYGLFVGQKWQR